MTGNEQKKKSLKYVIIHGHFYQPPRENPWIDLIENQPSAAPHHDWNERIYDQCYRPNAYSRLLDHQGMIVDIYNNYQHMSFNFGPTLFSWLEQFHPLTAERIIQSDKESCKRFDGHGNAVAQVFNHIIMPLASRRDQLTQIRWAKQFFRNRFGRDPEGIWLAETAINMETVRCLIEEKIKFVILAPSQAESFRNITESDNWLNTAQHGIDTRRTYRIFPKAPDGKQLAGHLDAFFFDEGLSKEASFGDMLTDAHIFGNKIRSCFNEQSDTDQLVTLATDGETFGHHKPFGDMCLAYFFKNIASQLDIIPANFAYFLAKNPPRYEVTLKNGSGEGTAWSCAHGVGRWIRDCGCKTGGEDSWKQAWRTPLRSTLDKLKGIIDSYYVKLFQKYDVDPWLVRDKYISFHNSSFKKFKTFIEKLCGSSSMEKEEVMIFRKALEAQKFALYSFTSCGWFFTDISGIETVQNLAYACRALQLGIPDYKNTGSLEMFLNDLEGAVSNLPNTNGRTLVERYILSNFDHEQILAFTAATLKSLGIFKSLVFNLFSYNFKLQQTLAIDEKGVRYIGFSVEIENEFTGEFSDWSVLIAHRENEDLTGWVISGAALSHSKGSGGHPELWMGEPGARTFTLMDVFQTSQHQLTGHFLQKISKDTNARFGTWMKKHERELDILSRLNLPLPEYCRAPLSFVFQEQWDSAIKKIEKSGTEDDVFTDLLELTRTMNRFTIKVELEYGAKLLEKYLVLELSKLAENLNGEICDRTRYLLNIVDRFSIPVSKHKLEDMFHPLLNSKVHELYTGLSCDTHSARTEKRELLLKMLNFARRMNFNTDAFQVR